MANPRPNKKVSIRELESKRPTTIQTDKKEITPPKRVGEMVTKQDKLNKERLNKEGRDYYDAKSRDIEKSGKKNFIKTGALIAATGALSATPASPVVAPLAAATIAKATKDFVSYANKGGKAMKKAEEITMATEKDKIKQKGQPLRRFK
jgi:hypothetical protein